MQILYHQVTPAVYYLLMGPTCPNNGPPGPTIPDVPQGLCNLCTVLFKFHSSQQFLTFSFILVYVGPLKVRRLSLMIDGWLRSTQGFKGVLHACEQGEWSTVQFSDTEQNANQYCAQTPKHLCKRFSFLLLLICSISLIFFFLKEKKTTLFFFSSFTSTDLHF